MEYGSQTEYDHLRKVLMHRPSEEFKRITPGNKDAYLFRNVVYWRKFQRKHETYTDALRVAGLRSPHPRKPAHIGGGVPHCMTCPILRRD